MSMWTRLRDVMKANVYSLLQQSDNPERTARQAMEQFTSELGQVKAETAAVLADEARTKRALDESSAELNKLQRYAEKSVQQGDETAALRFLDKKASLAAKHVELQTAYERASARATAMKTMQSKLVADLDRLQTRYTELQSRMDAANAQIANGSATNALQAMEERANQALHEAEAWAEVRGGGQQEEDLDVLIARLEAGMNAQPDPTAIPTPQQELDQLKQQNGKL
ncbi:PspA/IM30 family protein [Paenibacillus hunanensis]|uniref:PspA/IM30 family protein n=1 Tax=Paenibacillus hunanensis TaxID=539262 RepID=UPI002026E2D8|nr:PspA/IM30 family protein [Paenibacillus hunanensis]MCL9661618.1 PspA/IM30 family protein [Paenibacillus hunanensis]